MADVLHRPPGTTAHILHRPPGTTAHVPNGPAGSLTDLLYSGSSAPPHVLHSSPGAPPHVPDSNPGSLADIPYGGSGARADLLDGPSGTRAQLPHGLAGSAADVLYGGPDSTCQLVQDLRVAVERGEHAVDDLRDVVETHRELGLCLDTRDAQVHPAERDVGAHVQFEQIQHLGLQRDMRPQILDVQVDLVDLQDRNVEEDIRARAGCVLLVVRLGIGVLVTVLGVDFVTVFVVVVLDGVLVVLDVAAHRHASAVFAYVSTIFRPCGHGCAVGTGRMGSRRRRKGLCTAFKLPAGFS
ncbi:hypothetical protein ACFVP3_16890 [Streptomyces sp. NPDC057806]|uniref:hypothetical protein n=1 Tax=Streptomyces sp. NPDC057806 TaxID=3346255 RepID=UPI0036C0977C